MDDLIVERVLRAVELVPPGNVVSYGDLGGVVGIGPRQVGSVMSTWGSGVAWWRVTNAAGELPDHLMSEARQRWAQEGIGLRENGRGCAISRYRADLAALAASWDMAVADLAAPAPDVDEGPGAGGLGTGWPTRSVVAGVSR